MRSLLIIFAILLLMLTLLSAFGGSIGTSENFLIGPVTLNDKGNTKPAQPATTMPPPMSSPTTTTMPPTTTMTQPIPPLPPKNHAMMPPTTTPSVTENFNGMGTTPDAVDYTIPEKTHENNLLNANIEPFETKEFGFAKF